MAPWFERMEARLSIAPWTVAPNANNEVLARGARKLGIAAPTIRRNVKGCADLGYCGMGCPINAKQSMLVTTIAAALAKGATLVTRARAERLVIAGDRVTALTARAGRRRHRAHRAHGSRCTRRCSWPRPAPSARPRSCCAAARPTRTASSASARSCIPRWCRPRVMPERIDGFAGAPQSIYADHFLDAAPVDGPMGYKLESPPLHPVLTATTLPDDGEQHARWMREFRNLQVVLALLRDGFHPDSPGGTVTLRSDGTPVLDYPLNAVRVRRRAARLPLDGGDPVRGRRDARGAGARTRRRLRAAGPRRGTRSPGST